MSNIRMFPASWSPPAQIICGMRSYSGAPGQLVDVPASNAQSRIGWTPIAPSGTTAQRPTNVVAGNWYIDTTLSAAIVYDGAYWRNPITSALV